MAYFIALLLFVLIYVIVRFVLLKVESLSSLADVLGIVIGILGALFYLGVLK